MSDWLVVDCHQYLSLEEGTNRIVFTPVKEGIVDVVLNDIYGTRILLPETNIQETIQLDIYKHQVCTFIRDNLRIISVGGSTNKAGKFMRLNFFIGSTEYKVSDIQYV